MYALYSFAINPIPKVPYVPYVPFVPKKSDNMIFFSVLRFWILVSLVQGSLVGLEFRTR
jgi:hypothetical protein